MPADHDLDPLVMTPEEKRDKRRYEAAFTFETQTARTFWVLELDAWGDHCVLGVYSTADAAKAHLPSEVWYVNVDGYWSRGYRLTHHTLDEFP